RGELKDWLEHLGLRLRGLGSLTSAVVGSVKYCKLLCLLVLPALRGYIRWNGLSPEIRHDLPDRRRRERAAVRRHPTRATIKDRRENRAVGLPVPPPPIHQTRPHPTGRAAAMAAVAVHRRE